MRTEIDISFLLDQVNTLLEKQTEIDKVKKEKFNVFRVLGLDANEVRTHSAFIAELLDPNGCHLMGDTFLTAFLEEINLPTPYSANGVSLRVEKYIGLVSDDYLKGGRLDIVLENDERQFLTIENKIHSKEGLNQIRRYLNYEKGQNYVLYLTLKQEKLELTDEELLFCHNITYGKEIMSWLKECYLKAIDHPILRESVKQYIKLIEELTSMITDEKQNRELRKIMFSNIEAAKAISLNFDKYLNDIKIDFQNDVASTLTAKIGQDWEVVIGNTADRVNAQIWVKAKNFKDFPLWFGLESFSGKGNFGNDFIIGLISLEDKLGSAKFVNTFEESTNEKKWWYDYVYLKNLTALNIDFTNEAFLAKLFNDDDFKQEILDCIVNGFLVYFNERSNKVLDLATKESNVLE